MTSGYNRVVDASGNNIPDLSTEFVFVFDIAHGAAVQKQAIPVANTFVGLAFAPDGRSFYVTGGTDDNVHTYRRQRGQLGRERHAGRPGPRRRGQRPVRQHPGLRQRGERGVGRHRRHQRRREAGGRQLRERLDQRGRRRQQHQAAELDLRPGKIDPAQAGVPGGEFPYGVAVKGKSTAYVSSIRDREIVVVDIKSTPNVVKRIQMQGNPNKMILNARRRRACCVAADNSRSGRRHRHAPQPDRRRDQDHRARGPGPAPHRRPAAAPTAWRCRRTRARSTSPTAAATRVADRSTSCDRKRGPRPRCSA